MRSKCIRPTKRKTQEIKLPTQNKMAKGARSKVKRKFRAIKRKLIVPYEHERLEKLSNKLDGVRGVPTLGILDIYCVD